MDQTSTGSDNTEVSPCQIQQYFKSWPIFQVGYCSRGWLNLLSTWDFLGVLDGDKSFCHPSGEVSERNSVLVGGVMFVIFVSLLFASFD